MLIDEQLKYYLENTAVTKTAIESRLTHPVTGKKYPARQIFKVLKQYADGFLQTGDEPRMIGLAGLRGVGKTTLMWQTAGYIHKKHKSSIYFFNVNTLTNIGLSLHQALEGFQQHVLKRRFSELTDPIILLFDEVHDDENWAKTLKILYDEARSAFVLCTGSSALLLSQTADLARRMRLERIFPFSFPEYLIAKSYFQSDDKILSYDTDLAQLLKETLFFSTSAEEVVNGLRSIKARIDSFYDNVPDHAASSTRELITDYIHYRNIPSLLPYKNNSIVNDSLLDLFRRVVKEDIPKLKPAINDLTRVEPLLLRLSGSDEINPEKLAGIIGIRQGEILEILEMLGKAELLNILNPFGGLDTRIMKNRKAFFMSPSLRKAMLSVLYGISLPQQFQSKLNEDLVVMYLRRILTGGVLSYHTGKDGVHPDLVVETRDKPVLLEIGTGKLSARQLQGSTVGFRYGLLVSGGVHEPALTKNIIKVPFTWFLLL